MEISYLSSKCAGLILLLNLTFAFSFTLPDPQGDVTVEFRLIKSLQTACLQINASVAPGQTVVADSVHYSSDSVANGFISLFARVGWDSLAYAKGIVQERKLVPLSDSVLTFRKTNILITRNGVCDTIRQIPVDGDYIIFMPPLPTCKDAVVSDQDSLLALLKQKYDSSSAVCILDTLPATYESAEVGYDSLSSSGLCHWSSFNRHDDFQKFIFNFKLSEKLKGIFLRDTISFSSYPSGSTYFFRSSQNNSPIYHQDSIKTCGVNMSLWVPYNGIDPYVDYRYRQWLVFYSYSPINGLWNPGFPSGWSCPYLSRSNLHVLDPITLQEVVQPARIGAVVPILHDSIRFNDSSIVPLSVFLKSIGQSKVQPSLPVIHATVTAVRIRNGNFILTVDDSRKGSIFEVSIYDISGRIIFHRTNIAPGTSICSAARFAAGTYMVSVKATGDHAPLKTAMVSIVK